MKIEKFLYHGVDAGLIWDFKRVSKRFRIASLLHVCFVREICM